MRNIFLFMMTSLDGFFEGANHDIDWHQVDEEFNDFAIEQMNDVDMLIFGRVTYQLMESYWPTQVAIETDPAVAQKMNSFPKIVVSRTLDKADWSNTRLLKDHVAQEISNLKQQPGKDLAIFGSSDLTVSLIRVNLVDEFRIMVNPVVLGEGKRLFQGLDNPLKLSLKKTRSFRNGNVLFYYEPQR